MIKTLSVKNYKSIAEITLPLKMLNVFIGTNSSGKSTALQALLFAIQNIDGVVGLNGVLLQAGGYDEVHCRYSAERTISSSIVDECGNGITVTIEARDGVVSTDYSGDAEVLKRKLSYDKGGINHLSCNRIGPNDTYPKNMSLLNTIGANGEYAMWYLNTHGQDRLDDELCKTKSVLTLLGQVNWWLRYIADAELSTEDIPGSNFIAARYHMGDISGIRPGNIGAGVSYLISVLIICLSSKKGSVLVIENPEIHLHPRAQSRLCDFLYFISESGRQLFVESHSDHIFNGFRAGISDGTIDSSNVSMDFFYLSQENLTKCEQVKIGIRGRVENPLPDMFDQFSVDLDRMLGI